MIEAIAQGPVRFHERERIDKRSGWDHINGTVTTTRTAEVKVHLEFPQGYANLEGYALSSPGGSTRGAPIGSFDYYLDLGRDAEIVADEWESKLVGDWWGWVQQAHRYQVERPERSILDCLTLFGAWDEVNNRAIEMAKDKLLASREVAGLPLLAETDMGDLSDAEYRRLTDALNELDNRVNAKQSYKPETTA